MVRPLLQERDNLFSWHIFLSKLFPLATTLYCQGLIVNFLPSNHFSKMFDKKGLWQTTMYSLEKQCYLHQNAVQQLLIIISVCTKIYWCSTCTKIFNALHMHQDILMHCTCIKINKCSTCTKIYECRPCTKIF